MIDSHDTAFNQLVVWQDANHNGISDTGELTKLADLGIKSIDLGTTAGTGPVDGQNIAATGSFTYADGSKGAFVEVDLDASLGAAPAQPDSHPAEAHDLSAFAAVAAAEIDHRGGNIDLSALHQAAADHAAAPQGHGGEAPHAEAHDLSVFVAVAAEIDHGGGNIDLSALHQAGSDHAPALQGQGGEAFHSAADAGAMMPPAIAIMHEQAALAMQLAAH